MSEAGPKSCSTLAELAERLRSTDLVPSQQPLLERTDERFAQLNQAGITSVEDLREQLRSKKSVRSLADRTGVDEDYLILLRRAVRGFFPQPEPLRAFDWIPADVIAALAEAGINNSEQLRAACATGHAKIAERFDAPVATVRELAELSGLVRVQWVNPNFARALLAAGYRTPAAVAAADPADLVQAVADANEDRRSFNATIGERDMRRVVDAAGYVD